MLIRQGDVLLKQVDQIPQGKREKCKSKILAYGEATGHHHNLVGQLLVTKRLDKTYCEVQDQEATLIHQEHEQVKIPKGKYEIILQQEHDLVEGVRQVMD